MKRISLIAFVFLVASQAQAFKAKPGFVKVELTSVQDIVSPMPVADLLAHFGGDDVADYGVFYIVYLPKGLLVAFGQSANASGLRVRVREELDRIDTPGASVDAREGIHGGGNGNLIRSYPAARRGLYLLQFIGPVKAEWSAALRDLGWTVVTFLLQRVHPRRKALACRRDEQPAVRAVRRLLPPLREGGRLRPRRVRVDVLVEFQPDFVRTQPRAISSSRRPLVHARPRTGAIDCNGGPPPP